MAKEVVKIGVILPLTGSAAPLGQECLAGVRLLEDELKTKPTAYEYRFIVEDDQMLPKLTAMTARKLLEQDKVDVIVPIFSSPSNVVKPFAQKQGVVMVGNGCSDQSVGDGKLCFNNAAKTDKQAEIFLGVMKALGMKKLAILSVRQQGANQICDEVIELAPRYGVEIVDDERFIFGEREFRTLWLKIKEKQPDLVFLMGFDPELSIIMRHKEQMGVTTPISSIEFIHGQEENPFMQNVWFVGSGCYTMAFKEKCDKLMPNIKKYAYAGYTYDSVGVIVAAYEKIAPAIGNRKPTGEQLAKMIRNNSYYGALGHMTIDENGTMDTDARLWWIGDNKLTPVTLPELQAKLATVKTQKVEPQEIKTLIH